MSDPVSSELVALPDASQASPTLRRPPDRGLARIDWSPLFVALAATWGLFASIWPHSAAQRYAAITYFAVAALQAWAWRVRVTPLARRIAAITLSVAATAALALAVSGASALIVWGIGVLAAVLAIGISPAALHTIASLPVIGTRIAQSRAGRVAASLDWSTRSSASLVALGLAEATWWRTGSLAAFVALGALAMALAWLTRSSHQPTPPDRAVERAAHFASAGISLLVTAVVATPLLYVPALVVRATKRVRGGPNLPVWTAVSADPVGQRADCARMFVTPRRGSGYRANATAAVAVLAAAAITIAVLASVDRRPGQPADVYAAAPPQTAPATTSVGSGPTTTAPADKARLSWTPFSERELVPYSKRLAYMDNPLGDEIQADQGHIALSANAVGGNRVDNFTTKTFTVKDGERASLQPTCVCPKVVLWFFGGSAAFGIGQRNEHTIASELVRLAERDGIALQVHNFGSPGWTIWQEFQAFSARIAEPGIQKPDLAVFYDGFNDAVGSLFEAGVHGIRPDIPTLVTNGDVWSFVAAKTKIDSKKLAEVKASARDKYRTVQQVIDQVGAANTVDINYFFQPDAFTAPVQERAIKDLYGPDFSIFQQLQMTEMLDSLDPALTSGSGASSVSLRHLFDKEPKTVFLDYVHTNEYAAKAVAAAMYPSLRTAIVATARS